jgi:NADH:ubiquinone oxidoreductase subunit
MTTIGTRLHTALHGQFVGRDEFGNQYFTARKVPKKGFRRKRWVIYNGQPEPSKVPPHWHGWLHYTVENPPVEGTAMQKYKWQKQHLPNLTGTDHRYLPKGHVMRGAKRAKNTSDYVAWKPE